MSTEELTTLLVRLSKATKNQPTADDIDLILECVIDNQLTDDEIKRGYRVSRDQPEPWWPKPGEFLDRARPGMILSENNRRTFEAADRVLERMTAKRDGRPVPKEIEG